MAKRRCRFCGFGQPPSAAPPSSRPDYLARVNPGQVRAENAPTPSDFACGAVRGKWPYIELLDGEAVGWGARSVARRIMGFETMRKAQECDPACQTTAEENISHHADYLEQLAASIERKVKWCESQARISPAELSNALHKLTTLRSGLRDVRTRQESRGYRKSRAKKPETSWLFPITIKPKPECTDRVLGNKILQAQEMVDKAAEIDADARHDRLHNQSYFRRLMLAQGVLNRLALEVSDCVKWEHPPSPEIVAARRRLSERIEEMRHGMKVFAGLRRSRRR